MKRKRRKDKQEGDNADMTGYVYRSYIALCVMGFSSLLKLRAPYLRLAATIGN